MQLPSFSKLSLHRVEAPTGATYQEQQQIYDWKRIYNIHTKPSPSIHSNHYEWVHTQLMDFTKRLQRKSVEAGDLVQTDRQQVLQHVKTLWGACTDIKFRAHVAVIMKKVDFFQAVVDCMGQPNDDETKYAAVNLLHSMVQMPKNRVAFLVIWVIMNSSSIVANLVGLLKTTVEYRASHDVMALLNMFFDKDYRYGCVKETLLEEWGGDGSPDPTHNPYTAFRMQEWNSLPPLQTANIITNTRAPTNGDEPLQSFVTKFVALGGVQALWNIVEQNYKADPLEEKFEMLLPTFLDIFEKLLLSKSRDVGQIMVDIAFIPGVIKNLLKINEATNYKVWHLIDLIMQSFHHRLDESPLDVQLRHVFHTILDHFVDTWQSNISGEGTRTIHLCLEHIANATTHDHHKLQEMANHDMFVKNIQLFLAETYAKTRLLLPSSFLTAKTIWNALSMSTSAQLVARIFKDNPQKMHEMTKISSIAPSLDRISKMRPLELILHWFGQLDGYMEFLMNEQLWIGHWELAEELLKNENASKYLAGVQSAEMRGATESAVAWFLLYASKHAQLGTPNQPGIEGLRGLLRTGRLWGVMGKEIANPDHRVTAYPNYWDVELLSRILQENDILLNAAIDSNHRHISAAFMLISKMDAQDEQLARASGKDEHWWKHAMDEIKKVYESNPMVWPALYSAMQKSTALLYIPGGIGMRQSMSNFKRLRGDDDCDHYLPSHRSRTKSSNVAAYHDAFFELERVLLRGTNPPLG